jgi:hypothetical protein
MAVCCECCVVWYRILRRADHPSRGVLRQSIPATGPIVAPRVGRGIALLFHDHGTRRGEWSAARPCRTLRPR